MFKGRAHALLPEALPNDGYPVHRLVHSWWQSRCFPGRLAVRSMREELYSACLEEIRQKAAENRSYDPGSDCRVTWASHWLEVAEGSRRQIDPNIESIASLLFAPCPEFCGKDFAAGSHLES